MSGPPEGAGKRSDAAGIGREVYIEFHPAGNSVKVVAVDSLTGLEVTIIGPVSAARRTLEQNAIRKLKYMLAKTESE